MECAILIGRQRAQQKERKKHSTNAKHRHRNKHTHTLKHSNTQTLKQMAETTNQLRQSYQFVWNRIIHDYQAASLIIFTLFHFFSHNFRFERKQKIKSMKLKMNGDNFELTTFSSTSICVLNYKIISMDYVFKELNKQN